MQVRKLIRLLSEAVEKNPSVKYMRVCVDRKFVNTQCDEWRLLEVNDIDTHWCIWNPGETENEIQKEVLVIGNY